MATTPLSYGAKGHQKPKFEQTLKKKETKDTLKSLKLTHENVYKVLLLKGIKHPDIVMAQICLESGHFTSNYTKKYNNIFGIYKKGKIKSYKHWTDGVDDYKKYFTNRYKGGCYYSFLTRIGYAADPNYIIKIKKVQKHESKKSYCKQRASSKMV